jgi:hypothetical protein
MSPTIPLSIEKPALHHLLGSLEACGQVVSVFLKPDLPNKPNIKNPHQPIHEFIALDSFQKFCADLGKINQPPKNISTLNRLEFEGSLASVILQGGCHRCHHGMARGEASAIVLAGLEAVFPEPFSSVTAYRVDDKDWCALTDEATISHLYFVNEGARGLWWVLCIADFD